MTFDPVVNFVKQAAKDPDVWLSSRPFTVSVGDSPIIAALAQAAENGKQVAKARFDEENNIIWAKMLEEGCHVIYGLVGLKTHSNISWWSAGGCGFRHLGLETTTIPRRNFIPTVVF